MAIKLSDFDFHLPKEHVAQHPAPERDMSRLLVLDREKRVIWHRRFRDITEYLRQTDTLILNDTRVLTARIFGRKSTGGLLEILLLSRAGLSTFDCLVRPSRFKTGERISFENGINATLVSRNQIEFSTDDPEKIYALGKIPLPPYIKRDVQDSDNLRYQTVYARNNGSVAAPTAGLHFTDDVIGRIKEKGADVAYLTVHIGYATFKPVKCEDVVGHRMEEESFDIPSQTLRLLQETRSRGGRIIAVGTSSTRALETISLEGLPEERLAGKTGIFIHPGHKFRNVDCLLTNFHLNRTTPFMLVSAFAGKDLIMQAYKEAIEMRYRFLSFGDSMLII